MKLFFKTPNSPSNDNKIATISHKIFNILFIIMFISFSITAIYPEQVSASVKKNTSITKSKKSRDAVKNNKNKAKINKSVVKNNKNGAKTNKSVVKNSKNRAKVDKSVVKNNKNGAKTNKSVVKNSKNRARVDKSVVKNNRNRAKSNRKIVKNNINIEQTENITGIEDTNIRIKQVSGIIKKSLHKTVVKMGLNKKLINQLSSIFRNTSALSNIQKGDIIQVAYQEKYVNGKLVKTGVITAAIVTSKKRSYHAYRFTYNGKHGYYDEKGNNLESSFLKAPLKYKEISSGFSTKRFHPIKHLFQPHNGIDYAAPTGTPIKSVGDGIVIFKGYADSAGNYLKIKHPNTYISEYMHLSKFHRSIKVNKRVSKGDVIGYVGSTGYATGPHLHLGLIVNNQYVDYQKLKLPIGNPLPKQLRNLFFQHVAMVNKQWNRNARRELSLNNHYPLTTPAYLSARRDPS